jgi:hypothetical protein
VALRKHEAALAATTASLEWGGNVNMEVRAAVAGIDAAETELAEAKTRAAERFVNPEAPQQGLTVTEARAALQAAQDRADIARSARSQLESRVKPLGSEVHWAAVKVHDLAMAVIREAIAPRIAAFIAETDRLQREVAERGHLLEWLALADIVPDRGPAAPANMLEMVCRASSPPMSWSIGQADASRQAWEAALEALKVDPLAELPGLAG